MNAGMEWDAARCYKAFLSHDRRFDGRIFAGVVTTGVYCRPVCPVPPAKAQNVRFFACAAAAEAAGFRPCRRCRPEAAPGTPAWAGTSAVASRALRLIADGALDEQGIEALAARLGMGARQLRRLFATHLGASPVAIAQARRVHFARRLLDETDLPIAQVAFAAGFSSIRQFNHAVRATFRASPTELRRARSPRSAGRAGQGLLLRLAYRPPFDWQTTARFLAPRATPGVEVVTDDAYRRTIEINGVHGWIDIRPGTAAHLLLSLQLPGCDALLQVVTRVRRMFDLDADPVQISDQLRRSAALAALVAATPGVRVPGTWDGFELAVRAVLGQQVTVRGATTLAGRLVRAFGTALPEPVGDAGLTHLFPTAPALATADVTTIGLPRARAQTIRALARGVCDGSLVLDAPAGLDDAVWRLCSIPGIGEWTAHYIAMRAFGEPDAFPATDLGLRQALGNGAGALSAGAVTRLAEPWRPWRAYAAMHLWTNLHGNKTGVVPEKERS